MSEAPHSPDAEASVVGGLLSEPARVADVVGTMLEPTHFYVAPMRALFDEIVAAYYGDDPIDPLTIGTLCSKALSKAWSCDEQAAVRHVGVMAEEADGDDAVDHARIVKRDADYRALLDLSAVLTKAVEKETDAPEEIAAEASQTAMKIATSSLLVAEIITFEELGRRFVQQQRRLMAARAQGIELGAYFDLPFLDNWTRGLQPTELFFLAGMPGSGKSAVAWKAAQQFAERQLKKPEDSRIGTLVLSLEMGEEPSSVRVAQTVTGIDGGTMREGRTSDADLQAVIKEWSQRREIPLLYNHASILRTSQLRALIVEAIRRHNVGFVIIDHWGYVDMEGNLPKIEAEEEKARFLKQRVAKDLNVAVMVLAHTTKGAEQREGSRPKLADLRGSGQIGAEADFVAFVHRPYEHATEEQREEGKVHRTEAELIYEKNRHGLTGIARFHFDPSTMTVR